MGAHREIVVVCALLVAGCSAPAPKQEAAPAQTVTVTSDAPAQSMTQWKQQAADSVGAVGDALVATGNAMQDGPDFPAMRVGCADMRSAADNLERQLPSPDVEVNSALSDTIDNYRSASQLCMTLGPGSSVPEIKSMRRFMDAGGERMYDAFDLMGLNVPRP